ncbi:hypothetical protein, partial [Providencia rettgeri]|uniref:hypothetical protein n=1 Tax=Providencia rettgeri TaxID=587 RepID=UPI001C83A455
CSPRHPLLPPSHNPNYFEYWYRYFMVCAVAVLAALGCLGHILLYAPQDILFCRLATTRTILNIGIDILWFVR